MFFKLFVLVQTGSGIGDATPAVLMVLMIFIFPKEGRTTFSPTIV
jgi:hypothetical protein